ncbi:MAG: hypothetical protein KAG20_01220 [Cocleimonas sp.]|nr:hypothetical protein [Cocleimonas sp.]
MKAVRARLKDRAGIKSVKIFVMGLLLFALTACDKDAPQTTEINLSLPNIEGDLPPVAIITGEGNDPLDPVIAEPVVIKTEEQSTDATQGQQYVLSPSYLRAKSKQIFAVSLQDSLFLGDKFYPLGWSSNGEKFSYAIEKAEGSIGFFIQDLVSDKIIWKMKKTASFDNATIDKIWQRHHKKVVLALKKHKITLGGAGLDVNLSALSYSGATFSYTVKATTQNDGQIKAYRVLLNSTAKGSKEISKGHFQVINLSKGDYGSKEKIAVVGYFQGGDKGRVATLLGLMETGKEGVRIMRYQIIGASLKYGKWR